MTVKELKEWAKNNTPNLNMCWDDDTYQEVIDEEKTPGKIKRAMLKCEKAFKEWD